MHDADFALWLARLSIDGSTVSEVLSNIDGLEVNVIGCWVSQVRKSPAIGWWPGYASLASHGAHFAKNMTVALGMNIVRLAISPVF